MLKPLNFKKRFRNILDITLDNHPNIATSYDNIGAVYASKGEFDKALEFLQKSLEGKLISLPPNHPNIATSFNNIGLVYNRKGEYEKAFEFLKNGLEIYLISLRPNHPDIENHLIKLV